MGLVVKGRRGALSLPAAKILEMSSSNALRNGKYGYHPFNLRSNKLDSAPISSSLHFNTVDRALSQRDPHMISGLGILRCVLIARAIRLAGLIYTDHHLRFTIIVPLMLQDRTMTVQCRACATPHPMLYHEDCFPSPFLFVVWHSL